MIIIVFAAMVVAGMLGGLAYLWDFSRASRRDALFLPATDRRTRQARRVTGVYVRDYAHHEDELVGRW
ncbi:hypothetical protein [Spirillospora sp. CA-128828]|uniref:hypothetical protein n=1 Tax=Spirillospora sp. CA-128828 TaxID=3240033 RepID=UPI003D8E2A46